MNGIVRIDGYESLDQSQLIRREISDDDDDSDHRPRTMKVQRTTRTQLRSPMIWRSLSYRRERARKRHIFLQSYKLETYDDNSGRTRMKKIAVKMNSVLSFMWSRTLRSDCNCQSSIRVVPSTRIIRYR